jgi:hypothetical protein
LPHSQKRPDRSRGVSCQIVAGSWPCQTHRFTGRSGRSPKAPSKESKGQILKDPKHRSRAAADRPLADFLGIPACACHDSISRNGASGRPRAVHSLTSPPPRSFTSLREGRNSADLWPGCGRAKIDQKKRLNFRYLWRGGRNSNPGSPTIRPRNSWGFFRRACAHVMLTKEKASRTGKGLIPKPDTVVGVRSI